MKRTLLNLICCFIPSKNLRKTIRGKKNISDNEKNYLILNLLKFDITILTTIFDVAKEIDNDEILKLKLLELKSQYVNTKEFWDNLFSRKEDSWQNRYGDYQTKENILASLQCFPENIKNEIIKNSYSIVDFGCALGDGEPILSDFFENKSNIIGIDISTSGVEIAKEKYKNFDFKAVDLTQTNDKFDVLYSSNVFEHFVYPYDVINSLIKNVNKYFIIVVPYNDNISREHFFSFNDETILKNPNKSLELIYSKSYNIHSVLNKDELLYYKNVDYAQIILIYKIVK